ncbi:cohesin domain-containing protein, partial [Portibacter lacus]
VTTLDLILIQKHLLNIQRIENAYDLIAADINNDESIKATDLLQLRKLILGLYEGNKLPNNDSWRFVSKDYEFNDATQPWPFDEVANVEALKNDMMDADFVAVKIGDINNTVVASANANAQVRESKTLTLEIADANYNSGDEVSVSFKSSDFNEVYGYQFTLEFAEGLEFVGVESGSLKVGEGNFGLNRIEEGIITTSFDDVRGATVLSNEVLFTLNFKANKAVKLSETINISSKVTAAEAYVGTSLEVNEVSLRTNRGENLDGFALYQNEPNPFKGSTMISFNLPEASSASLTIYDVTGKVLYTKSADYKKGQNREMVKGLDVTGVMYYQINAGEYSA